MTKWHAHYPVNFVPALIGAGLFLIGLSVTLWEYNHVSGEKLLVLMNTLGG